MLNSTAYLLCGTSYFSLSTIAILRLIAGVCRRNALAITATIQEAEMNHTTIVATHHMVDHRFRPLSHHARSRALHTCDLVL